MAQPSPWHLKGMSSLALFHAPVVVTAQAGQQRRPQTLSPTVQSSLDWLLHAESPRALEAWAFLLQRNTEKLNGVSQAWALSVHTADYSRGAVNT